jgi:hypothetical protein
MESNQSTGVCKLISYKSEYILKLRRMPRGKNSKRAFMAMQSESDGGAVGSNSYSLTSTGSTYKAESKWFVCSNTSDLSAYVIFKNLEWSPYMLTNGSFDFITEGKIGGKDIKSIVGAFQDGARSTNQLAISKRSKDTARTKIILSV